MKLKYYLRGIGIGIVFSTIVFSVAITSDKTANLTDEAVMKRAKELGMVYSNNIDDSLTLNDLLNQPDKTENEAELGDNLEPIPTDSPVTTTEQAPTAEPTPTTEQAPTAEPTPTTEQAPTAEPTPTAEQAPTVEPTPTIEPTKVVEPTKVAKEYVSITVAKGMSSEDVAKLLANEGVISDNGDFNKYLKKHNYSKRIYVGTYRINKDASYEEIAKIITKKK